MNKVLIVIPAYNEEANILITNRMKEEASECFRLTCEAIESERE